MPRIHRISVDCHDPDAPRDPWGVGAKSAADHRLTNLDPTLPRDTIMITGKGMSAEESDIVVNWLRQAAPYARRIVSICGGAWLLAQAGLLDGRRATTHWRVTGSDASSIPQCPRRERPNLSSGRQYLDLRWRQFGLRPHAGFSGRRSQLHVSARCRPRLGDVPAPSRGTITVQPFSAQPSQLAWPNPRSANVDTAKSCRRFIR
ncbi:transcriptional activator FtrA [Serratia fonticola]|uniref:Transcriptional activator FtrA n=1 Tax=Serratia fonticola TaxID=47917 RepID=A0A4U9WMM2_SERFO|nr:transcriptional activator FtrA [Serratia fonticola]